MAEDSLKVFLTDYVCSLLERTRVEKNTVKVGFDWVIYQIALVKDWVPIRLPFFRQPGDRTAKTKTEAEFGVDLSFLANSNSELFIYVLKDEALNNKNWTSHNFDSDLRMASAPDLNQQYLSSVKSVKVILAYNKDEDQTGIRLFDNLVSSFSSKIGDESSISVSYDRWNLTKIVEEVHSNLFTPDLLPQHLSAHFRYICFQFRDFHYQTQEWENQLIPNWRSFLKLALTDPIDERKIRLIPVMLMILQKFSHGGEDFYPGWIDMVEWAVLSLWDVSLKISDGNIQELTRDIVAQTWFNLYINELERYFVSISPIFSTEHGFSAGGWGFGLPAVNDAYLAYWHIGRLGILTLAPQELILNELEAQEETVSKIVNRSAEWISSSLRLSPSMLRPLIDLNHIELFFIWLILWQAGRMDDIYYWLSELEYRLLMRRSNKQLTVPFIESQNRLDLVAEYAAIGTRPPEFIDSSSYLLLMVLELCISLGDSSRDNLLERFMKRIIQGITDDGKQYTESTIDLLGWIPPEDWAKRVLSEEVVDGIAVTTGNFQTSEKEEKPLSERIKQFVATTRSQFPWQMPEGIPISALILGCIKNRSPLPPELWRSTIFPVGHDEGPIDGSD